jgi:uncharacterized lipoprotein YbaY/heat shock protein HslJ
MSFPQGAFFGKGMLLRYAVLLLLPFLTACASGGGVGEPAATPPQRLVLGTAIYRERIALPPGAAFEATLSSQVAAGAPEKRLELVRVENPSFPPIAFALPYLADEIDPSLIYSVRAAIRVGNDVMFASDKAYPVLTHGAPGDVEVLLVRAAPASAASPAPVAPAAPAPATPAAPAPVPPSAAVSSDSGGIALPARFEGTLPCADCPGIRYRLDLAPDHSYRIGMTYLERDTDHEEAGRWEVDGQNRLMLKGQNGITDRFLIVDPSTLEKLDGEGKPIKSAFNYRLKRQAGDTAAAPPLAGTHWRLVSLNGKPPATNAGRRPPFLQLTEAQHRFSASAGCNTIGGSYMAGDGRLAFSQMVSTMMACGGPVDGLERQLKAFLSVTRQYRIVGKVLEITAQGGGVAQFEAEGAGR